MKIVLFATAWGPKHGGINAFNRDFAVGLAELLGAPGAVICVVLTAGLADRADSEPHNVTLISIDQDGDTFDPKWLAIVAEAFAKEGIDTASTCWVGHDVTSGAIAIEAAQRFSGTSALIHHMAFREYQSQKSGNSQVADTKANRQRDLFNAAKRSALFAVGPLLKDSCERMTGRACTQLVPGFPPEARPNSSRNDVLEALTFGRMDRADDRIKQGRLAVAAFGAAVRTAKANSGNPPALANNPEIAVLGLSADDASEEAELRALAKEYADRDVRFFGLSFEQERKVTFERLRQANLALMLSLHEGFGLTGWEAIAFEVPLILSEQSGLFRLIYDTLGGLGVGGVVKLDIRGARAESERFHPEDLRDVAAAYQSIAGRLPERKRDAKLLKQQLISCLGCTWKRTAETFLDGLRSLSADGEGLGALGSIEAGVDPVLTSTDGEGSGAPVSAAATAPGLAGASVPVLASAVAVPELRGDRSHGDPDASFRRTLGMLGFLDLRFPVAAARGFQRFLYDDGLPYFSRDDYLDEVGEVGHVLSERAIIQKIQTASSPLAILIDGPGGFGKTRLARRLCLDCGSDLALQIDQASDFARLRSFLEAEQGVQHLVMLLDYAENFKTAHSLRYFCEELQESLKVRTTLILCSRSSGSATVRFMFRDLDPLQYSLGRASGGALISYDQWLVAKILRHLGLEENPALVEMSRGMPFLAAFAGYMKTYNLDAFERQFGLTLNNADFARWAGARINGLDRFGSNTKRRMAEIALALPIAENEEAAVLHDPSGTRGHVFRALNDDLWVEQEGSQFVALHDTLADALVAEYLFGSVKVSSRLADILSTAIDKQYLRRALYVVNRLAGHDRFQEIDPVAVLLRLESKYADVIRQSAVDILRCAMVERHLIPQLIETVTSLFEGLEGGPHAHAFLAETAAYLVWYPAPTANQFCSPRFDALISQAATTSDPQILANLLAYDPKALATTARWLISQTVHSRDASYLIESYLLNVGDTTWVGSFVLTWLDRRGAMPRAGFVLHAWFAALKEEGRHGIDNRSSLAVSAEILGYLRDWCDLFGEEAFAAKCLQTLAETSGYDEKSLDLIDAWLGHHVRTYPAVHLLNVLIRARPAPDVRIAGFACQWLGLPERQRPLIECCYLFRNLSKSGYVFAQFESDLWSLITTEGPSHNRRDLCRYWLNWGGDPVKVREILRGIIAEDPLNEHVRFAFESWCNAAPGDEGFFRDEMQAWLGANAKHPKASYVFNLWHTVGLDPKKVFEPLKTWFQANGEDSQFPVLLSKFRILEPFLTAAIGTTPERAAVIVQQVEFGIKDCPSIEYILQAPYGCDPGTPMGQAAIGAAHRFLDQHVSDVRSAFLIARVVSVIGPKDWILLHAEQWLENFVHRGRACLVLKALLGSGLHPLRWEHRVAQWLVENPTYPFAGELFLAWADAGGDPSRFRAEAKTWLSAASEREGYFDVDEVEERFR
ncbi:glycosyltransferase [Roseomonas sp. CECT 9278]|uniref:glycosyltransferase n=1 Tax=Roseomonas sp. CECT 9278 TaxID=2845823 RepID=UPI001E4FD1C7|nr:glycosyltransferase [Roseomonas sp. CECT 9278]CAH0242525.1 hypothetical protein ROS9278_02932 [Roseomonas sp. CECT 9278]